MNDATRLLHAWRAGDESALEQLMPLIYEELRHISRRHLRGERADHSFQTTALLHEAYIRIAGVDIEWEGRIHFLSIASQMMRRILVDHARARQRAKRGGGAAKITLQPGMAITPGEDLDVIALDEALHRLSSLDPRKARVVEVHYFGGLTYEETAVALGISPATVHRELRLARAWLYSELRGENPDET